ncbi:hypothetical protein [Mesorhizobium sp. LNHC252B00]|uniref:hypothetical protein n=1 Tax=Mesorhizobium sp. LNHC252B00 TaxID=1287252 RepID=UPI0004CFC70B|nr:hypothetical protein [Mesorhizobium sp. LNHC252B00]
MSVTISNPDRPALGHGWHHHIADAGRWDRDRKNQVLAFGRWHSDGNLNAVATRTQGGEDITDEKSGGPDSFAIVISYGVDRRQIAAVANPGVHQLSVTEISQDDDSVRCPDQIERLSVKGLQITVGKGGRFRQAIEDCLKIDEFTFDNERNPAWPFARHPVRNGISHAERIAPANRPRTARPGRSRLRSIRAGAIERTVVASLYLMPLRIRQP